MSAEHSVDELKLKRFSELSKLFKNIGHYFFTIVIVSKISFLNKNERGTSLICLPPLF